MPLYEFACKCGSRLDRILHSSELGETTEWPCLCGSNAKRQFPRPQLLPGKVNPRDMNAHREMVECDVMD